MTINLTDADNETVARILFRELQARSVKARWQGIPKEERRRRMRELARQRWKSKGKVCL